MGPEGDYFETIERRIGETEARITAQLALIASLKDQQRSLVEAEGQLRNMLIGLKQLQGDRALMERLFNTKSVSRSRRRR